MSRTVRLALCQAKSDHATPGQDPRPANLERALRMIEEAASQGANLVLFGETYLNGYRSDQHLREYSTRLDPPDEHVQQLIEASSAHDVYLVMGVSRFGPVMPGNLFNSSVLIGPEGVVGWYDKVHLGNFVLPDGQVATEMVYWDVGREYRAFDTRMGRIGLQICRDVRYPEASRTLTLMGAELIVNVTAAPVVNRPQDWRVEHFSTTRAHENQVWFVMVGVLGDHPDMPLLGGSRIVSPTGQVIGRIDDHVEDILLCDIDLNDVARERALTHVLDRRVPSAYRIIAEDRPN